MGRTLLDINHSNIFLDLFSKGKETKANINEWDLIKMKSFCTEKETINKVKTMGEIREFLSYVRLGMPLAIFKTMSAEW